MVRHRAATVGLMLVALALGLGIALIDASPGWDDTGVSAAAATLSSVQQTLDETCTSGGRDTTGWSISSAQATWRHA